MNDSGPTRAHGTGTVGARLAAARTALGLELEDIAERTRIPLRHLSAIETSRFDGLPATTYAAGFIKTYARILALDGEALAADFRAERGDVSGMQIEYTPFEPADPSRVPPRLLAMVGLGAALLFVLVYLVLRGIGSPDDEARLAAGTSPDARPAAAAPQRARVATPAIAPSAAPVTESDKVTLTAREIVWIKVTDTGKTLFIGELAPGQTYEVPADAEDPRLLTGRPHAVQATVGTRVIAALGDAKRTIRDVSLKGPALVARAQVQTGTDAEAGTIAAQTAGTTTSTPPPTSPSKAVRTDAIPAAPHASGTMETRPTP